mmetsp:Transcript_17303/g.65549  ORF Transcript_17303/g.65549 Transcript_17303/m.65549 type:complete len:445 (-) Transcript_17303:3491-4825(-)
MGRVGRAVVRPPVAALLVLIREGPRRLLEKAKLQGVARQTRVLLQQRPRAPAVARGPEVAPERDHPRGGAPREAALHPGEHLHVQDAEAGREPRDGRRCLAAAVHPRSDSHDAGCAAHVRAGPEDASDAERAVVERGLCRGQLVPKVEGAKAIAKVQELLALGLARVQPGCRASPHQQVLGRGLRVDVRGEHAEPPEVHCHARAAIPLREHAGRRVTGVLEPHHGGVAEGVLRVRLAVLGCRRLAVEAQRVCFQELAQLRQRAGIRRHRSHVSVVDRQPRHRRPDGLVPASEPAVHPHHLQHRFQGRAVVHLAVGPAHWQGHELGRQRAAEGVRRPFAHVLLAVDVRRDKLRIAGSGDEQLLGGRGQALRQLRYRRSQHRLGRRLPLVLRGGSCSRALRLCSRIGSAGGRVGSRGCCLWLAVGGGGVVALALGPSTARWAVGGF